MIRPLLNTARLRYRRVAREDVTNLHALDSDPEVMRYINGGEPTPLNVIEDEILSEWMREIPMHPYLGYFVVEESDTGDFVGWFHFRPYDDNNNTIDLGYRLARRHWGKGYATEGSRAYVKNAFRDWGAHQVVAQTLENNAASRRVLEKAGLSIVKEFVYPKKVLPTFTAEERKAILYSITEDEYRASLFDE